MSECKECGVENSPDVEVCASCGASMSNEETKKNYHELKANSKIKEENFCKKCNNNFEIGEDIIQCEKCSNYYHKECFQKGGCNQPICNDEMKACPFCKNQIKKTALKCRFCGKYLDSQIQQQSTVLPKGTHSDAKSALVFGILSMLCCAIIFGPLAIVKANSAIRDIRYDRGFSGEGMATAGKVLGIVGICLWGLGILIKILAIVMASTY